MTTRDNQTRKDERLPRKILEALKEARKAATMEDASFGFPNDTVTASMHMETVATLHPDVFIKGETRLYRENWIIAPLDRAIAWAEGRKPR